MKSLLLYCCLLLALAGCAQDPTTGTTTVEGQVVEMQSRHPVPGAAVQAYHAGQAGGYLPVGTSVLADAQGRFSLHFEATSTTGYIVTANAAPGYFTPDYANVDLKAGRENKDVVISMLAPAWVRIQLVDELPKSRVVIHTQGYEGPGDTFYYPRDTVVIRPVISNFKTGLLWSINDQGINTDTKSSVQPNALDTVTVRIPF